MTIQTTRVTTLEQWLDADDGPSVRVDHRGGNEIDREVCEASSCTACETPSPAYLPLRGSGRYVALALCRSCGHVESF